MKRNAHFIKSIFAATALTIVSVFNSYAAYPTSSITDDHNGTYENEAISLESGCKVIFESENELKNFLMYYFDEYRLNNYNVVYYATSSNEGYSVYINDLSPHNRKDTEEYIIDTFGLAQGDTKEQKIYDVCNKIKDWFTYDVNYFDTDLITSINDKKGVCWQYAKTASVILKRSGINAKTVTGFLDGNYHMWIVSDLGDKKIYTDPVAYDTGNVNAWNIYLEGYLKSYIENDGSAYNVHIG